MGYFTVKEEAQDSFEEKKSIFIGSVRRVYTEAEAKKFISNVKASQKDAKHNVYAYVVGESMQVQRYSDDGEPQGSAGIPVLETIKKNNLTDVALVVTRYFGGILLGKGGLFRAYSKAASMAIEKGQPVERTLGVEIDIVVNYQDLDKIKYDFEKNSWHVEKIDYADKVSLSIYCDTFESEKIINKVIEITGGKCKAIVDDEEYYFKIGSRLYREL